jgi:ketosteroid isomerase-like protein
MADRIIADVAEDFLAAWNSRDYERVAACYTENLVYRDPNTKGEIRDQPSFKRYLKKLLEAWDMTWTTREGFPLKDVGGYAFLWHAVIRRPDGKGEVEVDGMDLVVMDGNLITRNEVYFDRAVLAPLMGK